MFVCSWCVLPYFGPCDEVDVIVDIPIGKFYHRTDYLTILLIISII